MDPRPLPLADPEALVKAMGKAHRRLVEDLARRAADPRVDPSLREAHARDRAEGRTGEPYEAYRDAFCDQVGASWVLCTVFARTLEDRGYLPHRLAGPGAADRLSQFRAMFRFLGDRDYLLHVFDALALLPGGKEVFGPGHAPLWRLAPTSTALGDLLDALRATDAGRLRFSFGRPEGTEHDGASTRYLGDLYQDLNEGVRKRYALLQTPEFVERFLLDNTLDPAIRERGIAVTVLDPACGSGHMLLGAYDRLFEARRRLEPGLPPEQSARKALGQVYGVDLNPYAAAVARFRLVLSYLEKAGVPRLDQIREPLDVQVYVGDSLLAGLGELQRTFGDTGTAGFEKGAFSFFDPETDKLLRAKRFDVVVANPPYITEKDAVKRELIRERYKAASGLFALSAPFMERIFQLGNEGAFTGQITANSFMKREFGARLVEDVLPGYDLGVVLDTSGAYFPGHGTPTVILFGRAQAPRSPSVRVVMSIRGEPTTPSVPAEGKVWSTIVKHHGDVGYTDEFISVADVERSKLKRHPWSLGGGGAADLKELLEGRATKSLNDVVDTIGFACITKQDEVFSQPEGVLRRARIEEAFKRPFAIGEDIRDWTVARGEWLIFPYTPAIVLVSPSEAPQMVRFMWPYRETLLDRKVFGGSSYRQAGRRWYEFGQIPADRFRTPLSVPFAFVATHNQFALDRGAKVFNRTSPIIKMAPGSTVEDHLDLLGYLNSSVACFWMKQVMMNKGATSDAGVLQADPEKFRFEFDGTKLRQLPLPDLARLPGLRVLSRALDAGGGALARDPYSATLEGEDVATSSRLVDRFAAIRAERDAVAARMVALQEELDWVVYEAFGLVPHGHPAASPAASDDPSAIGPLAPDDRPYRLKQHGKVPPTGSPPRFTARFQLIAEDPMLALLETPENKRRWYRSQGKFSAEMVTDDDIAHDALESYLLDRAEAALKDPRPQPIRAIAHTLSTDPKVRAVCEVLSGTSTCDLENLLADLMNKEAVASARCQRYTESGLEKRALWEQTWALQRREDAGEKVSIEVPPKYDQKDFEDAASTWRFRGKLDVPKERFVKYPSASPPPGAAGSKAGLVFGWAGWDHLQQLQAAIVLWQEETALHAGDLLPRATQRARAEAPGAAADEGLRRDAAARERLTPLLQTMADLLPWVHQWHEEDAPDFEVYVSEEALRLEMSLDEARAYRRPARPAPRARKTAAEPSSTRKEAPALLDVGPARAGLEPEVVLAAVKEMDRGPGAPVADLPGKLGASAAAVKKAVDALVGEGRLVERKKRPRLVSAREDAGA